MRTLVAGAVEPGAAMGHNLGVIPALSSRFRRNRATFRGLDSTANWIHHSFAARPGKAAAGRCGRGNGAALGRPGRGGIGSLARAGGGSSTRGALWLPRRLAACSQKTARSLTTTQASEPWAGNGCPGGSRTTCSVPVADHWRVTGSPWRAFAGTARK